MIVERERIYKKKDGVYTNIIRSTSWWLFGIIPLYIRKEIIKRY
jgi:hypothetical protein